MPIRGFIGKIYTGKWKVSQRLQYFIMAHSCKLLVLKLEFWTSSCRKIQLGFAAGYTHIKLSIYKLILSTWDLPCFSPKSIEINKFSHLEISDSRIPFKRNYESWWNKALRGFYEKLCSIYWESSHFNITNKQIQN